MTAAALMLLTPSGIAAAQPAGQGDVEIVMSATGSSSSKADSVSMLVPIQADGATPAEARKANLARIATFRASMTAAGVPQADVRMLQPRAMMGFLGNEVMTDGDGGPTITVTRRPSTAQSLFKVTVRNPAQLEAVRNALDDAGLATSLGPTAALDDPRPTRAEAAADAIANAKWQAEVYAKALNLKVVTLRSVRNACEGSGTYRDFTAELVKSVEQTQGGDPWSVETTAAVCMTFVARP